MNPEYIKITVADIKECGGLHEAALYRYLAFKAYEVGKPFKIDPDAAMNFLSLGRTSFAAARQALVERGMIFFETRYIKGESGQQSLYTICAKSQRGNDAPSDAPQPASVVLAEYRAQYTALNKIAPSEKKNDSRYARALATAIAAMYRERYQREPTDDNLRSSVQHLCLIAQGFWKTKGANMTIRNLSENIGEIIATHNNPKHEHSNSNTSPNSGNIAAERQAADELLRRFGIS